MYIYIYVRAQLVYLYPLVSFRFGSEVAIGAVSALGVPGKTPCGVAGAASDPGVLAQLPHIS